MSADTKIALVIAAWAATSGLVATGFMIWDVPHPSLVRGVVAIFLLGMIFVVANRLYTKIERTEQHPPRHGGS